MSKLQLTAEPGKQEMVTTCTFDAPRELVYKAFTDPAVIPLWWGPKYLTTTVDKLEARPGGQWRFVQRAPDGSVYGFYGVFHAVEAPRRLVMTFEFEGEPGHVQLQTATFEERDGKTRVTTQSVCQSVEDRDGMLHSGMEQGENESYERLEELLVKLEV
jgi:uncharacterized protein YndB with AHSA1/START domain